jgi:tripartite-type tricarboxylate transporter receptor subunit TctC
MFLAPAGTPPAIVARLTQEANKAVNDPEIRNRFSEIGIEPVGGTPEQTSRFLAGEIAKWAKVINTAGVKAEQ